MKCFFHSADLDGHCSGAIQNALDAEDRAYSKAVYGGKNEHGTK